MTRDPLALAADLRARAVPFALATVVRRERPTSARPGAKAVIHADGSVSGWVGGACAEPVVVRESLAALRDGQPRLIRLTGEGATPAGRTEGVLEYPMTCHSGGTLEIYVEPFLPRPALVLVGHGPVIDTLAALGRTVDFDVIVAPEAGGEELGQLALTPHTSIVVATHGGFDEDALAWALASDAGYVSLVGSRRRAAAVLASLERRGLPAERLGALRAPAGLDIGALTPEEVAVSILAEIVQARCSRKEMASEPAGPAPGEAEARDPICGMLVDVATARYRTEGPQGTVYFCCLGCKETFDAQPAR
jgi:xanthine dehydrogenase accessory factor